MRALRYPLVAAVLAFSAATIGYATIQTLVADERAQGLLAALAIALLGMLIGFRLLSPDQAADGVLGSVYRLLPDFVTWSARSNTVAAIVMTLAVSLSVFAIWIGPYSLARFNVLCDDAAFVKLGDEEPVSCEGWLSKELWRPVGFLDDSRQTVSCIALNEQSWHARPIANNLVRCGEKPRDPTFIVTGVDSSNIDLDTVDGRRTSEGLGALREHLDAEIPRRDFKDVLLLATWDIRDFDSNKFGWGPRLTESYYYIAEIISRFDIVAVQGAQGEAGPLERLLSVLGPDWRLQFSSISPGPAGNAERMAFYYDSRKVQLGKLITSVILLDDRQLARIPYVVSFNVGEKLFTICSVHIYFGAMEGERRERRINEIRNLAKYLKITAEREEEWGDTVILLGDLNAPNPEAPEIAALREAGFFLDPELVAMPSNHSRDRVYDQIAVLENESNDVQFGRIGVFDYFEDVFRAGDADGYRADMGRRYLVDDRDGTRTPEDRAAYYLRWRTWQMSDHLPKWAELRLVDER